MYGQVYGQARNMSEFTKFYSFPFQTDLLEYASAHAFTDMRVKRLYKFICSFKIFISFALSCGTSKLISWLLRSTETNQKSNLKAETI